MGAFRERWGKIFGSDPGFDTIAHLWEEVVSDYDDGGEAQRALDLSYYERASALGHDTSQHCDYCEQRIDQVETIGGGECFVCQAREENQIEEDRERRAEERERHERWYASLSPLARQIYDAEQREFVQHYVHGLIARDVQ